MKYAKVSDVKAGDKLRADGGFTCIETGAVLEVKDADGLYVCCALGSHWLIGQEEEIDGELVYVGLEKV